MLPNFLSHLIKYNIWSEQINKQTNNIYKIYTHMNPHEQNKDIIIIQYKEALKLLAFLKHMKWHI